MSETANCKVAPRLASLLGETYRSTEHAVKELVDNAWDADAPTILVTLLDPMKANPIVIEDKGTGMTEQELRNEYLVVANDRRSCKGDRTKQLKRLGKGRDVAAAIQYDPPRLQVFSYEALISAARTQLDWLLIELKTDEH